LPPEAVLLEAIRDELRMVRGRNEALISEAVLAGFRFVEHSEQWLSGHIDGTIVINRGHPVMVRALRLSEPTLVSMIASSAFTSVNRLLEEVTDGDEVIFHRLHAQHIASAVRVKK
jgi:hypothetical protein